MSVYVPILKSKPAEIWACGRAGLSFLAKNRAIFDLVPGPDTKSTIATFAGRLARAWPAKAIITVDSLYVHKPNGVVLSLAQALIGHHILERPVVHLDDSPHVLGEVRAACALHSQGACLRLGSEDEDPNPNVTKAQVTKILVAVGLTASDVDLLVDFSTVQSTRDVTRCLPLATAMLAWAATIGGWRSVTLASGAFPKSISNLPLGMATQLQRYDAVLFTAVANAHPAIQADYGDYGINYPRMPEPIPRGPKPNLRYADGLVWQVYREDKILPGNESFYTLCSRVVQSAHWKGHGYSPGDAEIDRCSLSAGGAGTATQWLAYGASHHFAHVADRLANLGVP